MKALHGAMFGLLTLALVAGCAPSTSPGGGPAASDQQQRTGAPKRLVAAILILVPVATRSAPAIAAGPTPLRARPAETSLGVDAVEPTQLAASSSPVTCSTRRAKS